MGLTPMSDEGSGNIVVGLCIIVIIVVGILGGARRARRSNIAETQQIGAELAAAKTIKERNDILVTQAEIDQRTIAMLKEEKSTLEKELEVYKADLLKMATYGKDLHRTIAMVDLQKRWHGLLKVFPKDNKGRLVDRIDYLVASEIAEFLERYKLEAVPFPIYDAQPSSMKT